MSQFFKKQLEVEFVKFWVRDAISPQSVLSLCVSQFMCACSSPPFYPQPSPTWNSHFCNNQKGCWSGCTALERLQTSPRAVMPCFSNFWCQSYWSVRLGSPMWTWAALRLPPFPAQLLDLLLLFFLPLFVSKSTFHMFFLHETFDFLTR